MQSLMTVGFEMKKALVLWKSDNNNPKNNNNVGSAWGPVSGLKNIKNINT